MKYSREELFRGRLGTSLFVASLITVAVIIVAPSFAGIAIFFDPTSAGVTNRVTGIQHSVPPERYVGATNVVVLNSGSAILTNPPSALKWTGSNVVLLSGAELTTIANSESAAATARTQMRERVAKTNALSSVNALNEDGRLTKALAALVLDEINILRTNAGFAPRTLTQLTNAITTKLNAQADNN